MLAGCPPLATLAAPDEEVRRRLSSLFEGMMRALFRQGGAEFRVELVADPAVQEFVSAHAGVLDSQVRRVEMSEAMRRRLTRSNYIFSGMKAFHELHEAFPSLLDENGDRKPFERFLNEVRSIDATYNANYLRAEYNFVAASAQMAARWEGFAEDGDRYNLQYRTAHDDKVRPEHAPLHGVTLPMSDPFWEQFYPPNGWNCFTGSTPVLTASGWRRIDEVKRGDLVVGGSGKLRKVIGTHTKTVDCELVRILTKGGIATCTENHRFCTPRGWVTAADLEPGDVIVQIGKNTAFYKTVNAVRNSIALVRYCSMSFIGQREPVAPLAVDDKVDGGDVEVDNIAGYQNALLEWKGFCRQVSGHDFFGCTQWLTQCAHAFGMLQASRFSRHPAFLNHFFSSERGGGRELSGDFPYKLAIGLGLALANVSALKRKAAVGFGKLLACLKSALCGIHPLDLDSLAALTGRDSALREYPEDRAEVHAPMGRKPSDASLFPDIQLFRGIRDIRAFNGFYSALDFIRNTFLHNRYMVVEGKITIKKAETEVYNLSVDVDESYVVPVGIAHNCRCTVVQVRKSKYPETPRDEAMRLGDEALRRDSKGLFRFNAGMEGKSFPDYNPYTIRRCRDCDIAKGKARLARFVPDNVVCQGCKIFHQSIEKIEENRTVYERLINDPDYHDVHFDEKHGGVKAIHKGHIIHTPHNEPTFFGDEKLTSTDLEKICQDLLFKKGYRCILLDETKLDSSGHQLPQLDTETNGEMMDIRAITEDNGRTIRNALKSKKRQLKNFNTKTGSDCHSVILYFHDSSLFNESQIKCELGHTLSKIYCVFRDGSIRIYKKS